MATVTAAPQNVLNEIDDLDRQILSKLTVDGKTPYTDLAKQLYVSSGTIHVRMKKMEQLGIVRGSTLLVDYGKLGFDITDAFCGFKAYRVSSLADLDITNHGYAMPLQLWVQAADLNWKISEFATPLVYLDEERSFGGSLDDAAVRLAHYREVLNAELSRRGMKQRFTADCGQSSS